MELNLELNQTTFLIYNIGLVVIFIMLLVAIKRDIAKKKEIEESRANFFWMAAHQLRTPLSNIKWNIELMLQDKVSELSPSIRQKILKNQSSVERMIAQVNEILNSSYMQQYQFKDELESVNVLVVIENIIKDMGSEFTKKNIKVIFNRPKESLPNVKVGRHNFYEVVQNILANAVKYNKVGGSVTVEAKLENKSVLITVLDTGVGIPKQDQTKIFTRFFRASNIKNSEGTGLALALIKSYVDHWHGRIWFESEENQGTTFYIRIPCGTL